MEDPARMIGQPFDDLGVLVGGVIVGDGVDDLSRWDRSLQSVEKLDEFLIGMFGHAASDDGAVKDVEGGEQGGGAVALVVVGHGAAFPGLERQARLGAVERLDCVFSSMDTTTAWTGGFMYRPTMSSTLAAKAGSLDFLKVRSR